jgi:hypothetical protein
MTATEIFSKFYSGGEGRYPRVMGARLEISILLSLNYNGYKRMLVGVNLGERAPQKRFLIAAASAAG